MKSKFGTVRSYMGVLTHDVDFLLVVLNVSGTVQPAVRGQPGDVTHIPVTIHVGSSSQHKWYNESLVWW